MEQLDFSTAELKEAYTPIHFLYLPKGKNKEENLGTSSMRTAKSYRHKCKTWIGGKGSAETSQSEQNCWAKKPA